MLLTKEVEVKVWGKTVKHFNALGYNVKHGDIITVKVDDLPKGSKVKIKVVCDFCGEERYISYYDYLKSIESDGRYACIHCVHFKTSEYMLKNYGVTTYSQTNECKEKVKQSNLERFGTEYYSQTQEWLDRKKNTSLKRYGYGCNLQCEDIKRAIRDTNLKKYGFEYATQSQIVKDKTRTTVQEKYGANSIFEVPEIRDKIFETNLSKYGHKYSIQSEEIRNKVKETNMRNLGVEYPMQSKEIRDKKEKTCLEKYNVTTPFALKEVREKAIDTMYKNGNIQCSIQQSYIYNLYRKHNDNVKLNYPIGKNFFADICLLNEKIVVEYDGKGHNLSVVLGNITQEEFDKKEIIRNNVIKHEGYKQMHIVSTNIIKLPSDSILLKMLLEAKEYFSTTNHSWCTYDIDQSLLFSAEHKDGIHYSFGELRTIKDSDINTIKENDLNTPRKEDDNNENVLW